jgi:hypothetical protein
MSYLSPLRLHFAGRFQASPSTVNNDPLHYDNSTFVAAFQERQTGNTPDQINGWWNPRGDAAWRLIGCRVTAAWSATGKPAADDDAVRHCLIADSDRKVTAKLVDLDSEQQLVSEIWGLEVRICEADGTALLRGRFEPAAFSDVWDRATTGGGDSGAGAMYQSVLSDLHWGDLSGSPFLQELRTATVNRLLSIKFNVDGYNMDFRSPDFTRGRIVGTIGPAASGEPRHFLSGRQFLTTGLSPANFFVPAGKINFCAAVVDRAGGKIYLDLGNALPSARPAGDPVDLGALSLACVVAGAGGLSLLPIGEVPYKEAGWYEQTAGVVELPPGRRLTEQELDVIARNPLALLLPDATGQPALGIAESPGGLHVRADQFVFRLEPGERAEVRLCATRWGLPYAGARILSMLDPGGLQPASPLGQAPAVAVPAQAIDFPARVVTDAAGMAVLPITSSDPGSPRGYIDGQVYGVRPALEETLVPAAHYPFNPWNFISLLVYSSFRPDEPPTWHGSMRPIFEQYANLYPVMKDFLDLGNYASVCANRRLLQLAFALDPADPNSMPVTRDLSRAKRRAILRWLADDPPLEGTAPAPPSPVAVPVPAVSPTAPVRPTEGGKTAAARQRLGLRLPGVHGDLSGGARRGAGP